MVSISRQRSSFRLFVGMFSLAALLVAGCTTTSSTQTQEAAAMPDQLVNLDACMVRTQQATEAAVAAGTAPQDVALARDGAAETQTALTEARRLLTTGQQQASIARAMQALEACHLHEALAVRAREDTFVAQREQAEARLEQVRSCMADARQAITAAEEAGADVKAVAPAADALARAEAAVHDAQTLREQREDGQTLQRLDAAAADCRSAQEMSDAVRLATLAMAQPHSYTVVRGDTLWDISGRQPIHADPVMWRRIYQANRDRIRNPNLIYPEQVLTIPRPASQ